MYNEKIILFEYNFKNLDVNSFFYNYFKTEFTQMFFFWIIANIFLIIRKYLQKKYIDYDNTFIIKIPKFIIFNTEKVDIFIFFSEIFFNAIFIKIIANALMFLVRF